MEKKIAVWSEQAFELCIADLADGKINRIALPEPDHLILATPHAQIREFHFSPTGDVLYYLFYAGDKTETGVEQKLTISALRLTVDSSSSPSTSSTSPSYTLTTLGSPCTLSNACLGPLRTPFMLSTWTPTHLYAALPNLSCDPKIVRVALSSLVHDSSSTTTITTAPPEFETLRDPVYFPSDAAERSPSLYMLPTSLSSHKLVLTLNGEVRVAGEEPDTKARAARPALVMAWDIVEEGGWRQWEGGEVGGKKGRDEASEQYYAECDTHQRLRGSFVDVNQRFNVPIRSGLDWTRKGVVSCI